MITELILILEQEINLKTKQFQAKKELLFGKINTLKKRIDEVINDPTKLSELNLEFLTDNLNIESNTIITLEMYQLFSKTENFPLELSQIEYIKKTFSTFKKEIIKKEEAILKENPDYVNLNLQLQMVKNIKAKLSSNANITITEFSFLSEEIRKNVADLDKCIELLSTLSIKVCDSYSNSLNTGLKEEKINDVVSTNLSFKELSTLFRKYEYDFNEFNGKDGKLLLQYGNLSNIENILKTLASSNIKINLKEYSRKFATILTLSTSEIVQTILNNIKIDLKDTNQALDQETNQMFLEYLNHPSIFIQNLKRYVNSEEKNHSNNDNNLITGAYDNYLKNRELFIELGMNDVNMAIRKCGSAFEISHLKVKRNVRYFDLYGMDRSVYLNALTCMSAPNPLDEIDKFIEVDCYDYIVSNISRVTFPAENERIVYQIRNAKNAGYTNAHIYRFIKNGDTKKIVLRRSTLLDKMNKTSLDFGEVYSSPLEAEYNPVDFSMMEPISETLFSNSFIQMLENNYKKDDLTYDFNGIIISRYKVLRNYSLLLKKTSSQDLNALMYAIIHNSLLTKSEYDMIANCLSRVYENGGTSKQ